MADFSATATISLGDFIPEDSFFKKNLSREEVEARGGIITPEDILFFKKDGLFFGWNIYECVSGVECYSTGRPDHICSSPNVLGWNPAQVGVSLPEFINLACSFFRPVKEDGEEETENLDHFVKMVESRPVRYQAGIRGASFMVIPTPEGWGYVYETNSARQFIWLPGDIVITRGLEESTSLRASLGGTDLIPEPDWLDQALDQALQIKRPAEGDGENIPVDNQEFFAKISSPKDGILREE